MSRGKSTRGKPTGVMETAELVVFAVTFTCPLAGWIGWLHPGSTVRSVYALEVRSQGNADRAHPTISGITPDKSGRAKTNSSNCLLEKQAVTAVCLCAWFPRIDHPTDVVRALNQRQRRFIKVDTSSDAYNAKSVSNAKLKTFTSKK